MPIFNQTISDSMSFSDSMLRRGVTRSLLSENLAFSETVIGKDNITRMVSSEVFTLTEVIIGSNTIKRLSQSDSFPISDNVSAKFTISNIRLTDSIIFSEKTNQRTQIDRSDNLFFNDSVTIKLLRFTLSEFLLNFSETISFVKILAKYPYSDALIFTESIRVSPKKTAFTDAINFGETLTAITPKNRYNLKETLTFTDNVTRFGLRVTDALAFGEIVNSIRGSKDTLTFADSVTIIKVKATKDVLVFGEVICYEGTITRHLGDTLLLKESVARWLSVGNQPPGGAPPDGLNLPTIYKKSVNESLEFHDRVTVTGGKVMGTCGWEANGPQIITKFSTDAIIFSESFTKINPINKSISDSLTIADNVSSVLVANFLLTENSEQLLTEDGQSIILE